MGEKTNNRMNEYYIKYIDYTGDLSIIKNASKEMSELFLIKIIDSTCIEGNTIEFPFKGTWFCRENK